MPQLNVYVSEDCWSCTETREIVSEMRVQFPDVEISLYDTDADLWPNDIFAVPTYMLDGRIISLGNPTRQHLQNKLEAAQSVAKPHGVHHGIA